MTTGTSSQVVERIRAAIRAGRYQPGHRLVEADLTRELGVSRGPVREALSRLVADGLVEIVPHRGASVRQMTRQDVADLFAVRAMLEGGAARLAAERIGGGADATALHAVLEETRGWHDGREPLHYVDANERFHQVVVENAGNRRLVELIDQLQVHSHRLLWLGFLTLERIRTSNAQHACVAEAILAGRAGVAEKTMRAHIEATREAMLSRDDARFR